jgi:hypothetical protein
MRLTIAAHVLCQRPTEECETQYHRTVQDVAEPNGAERVGHLTSNKERVLYLARDSMRALLEILAVAHDTLVARHRELFACLPLFSSERLQLITTPKN